MSAVGNTLAARFATVAVACAMTGVLGCAEETQAPMAQADMATFATDVYPILLRDCGFPACHGDTGRFFQVLGPGRSRLPDPAGAGDPRADATPAEIQLSYEHALANIDPESPSASDLLRKPLEVAAGGAGHRGVDHAGRDVYASKLEVGYVVLASWVAGRSAPATVSPTTVPQPGVSP